MKTLIMGALLVLCGTAYAADEARSDQVPGTEAADRGNPGTSGRGGDALTPGSEQDLNRQQQLIRDAQKTGELTPEGVEATGTESRPGAKPTGFVAAGLIAGIAGFTIARRRRRHRGAGVPPGT